MSLKCKEMDITDIQLWTDAFLFMHQFMYWHINTVASFFYRHVYFALSFHEAFEEVTLELYGKIKTFRSILKRSAIKIYQSQLLTKSYCIGVKQTG